MERKSNLPIFAIYVISWPTFIRFLAKGLDFASCKELARAYELSLLTISRNIALDPYSINFFFVWFMCLCYQNEPLVLQDNI